MASTLISDGVNLLQAAMWFEWNVDHATILDVAYGPHHVGDYLEEKAARLRKGGLLHLYGDLDNEGRRRLVTAIINRYHDVGYPAILDGGE